MTSVTDSQPERRTAPSALYLMVGFLLLVLAYTTFGMEIEPFWVLIAVPILLLLPVLVRRFPVFLMVALVYVGLFKTRGAVGLSVTDPTLLTALLLYATVSLHVLLLVAGDDGLSLRDLFAGQMFGVTTFCLLILVIVISYSYTPAPAIGREKVLKLVAFDAPIFLAPLILLRTCRDVRQLLLLSMLGGLILACRTVYRVLHPTAELLLGEQDPTEIGEGLLMGATALIALYYPFPEGRLSRMALIGCLVVLTCGTTASLSRSATVSLLLVATASLIFLRRIPTTLSRKAILIAVGAVVVTVTAASLWLWQLPATHSKFAVKASELSLTLQGSYPPGGTAGQRYSFSESAWQAFLSKPLLGWGAGGWSTLWHYSDERVLKYPHNFVLEIAAEQGLAGLAALALLLLAMLGASAKVLRGRGNRFVFILPVVALSLIGNAVTGQVETREMWFWCGTLFALARMACMGTVTAGDEPADRQIFCGADLPSPSFQ
jgi:O-antigen ligase